MESERTDQLAQRIRAMEGLRRPCAIGVAFVVGFIIMDQFDGSQSALANYGMMLATVLGALGWALAEIILGIAIAIAETRHHRLVRMPGIPRAVLRK